ncbi:MAG TPA: TraB/GumN family protein [Chitinophagaceae bacterium]|nr:TraB/GumN family protein [Chitinophagaceae bacterium]
MKNPLAIFIIAISITSCNAQHEPVFTKQKSDNTLLWEVSGHGLQRPSFLFGTFHLLCKDDIHLSDQLKKAVSNCKEVYMELDMDDPSTVLGGMLYMNMNDGRKLSDLYSPRDYKRLQSYFDDSLGVPLLMMQHAKPYFLVALLYSKMMNCDTPAGVEEELAALAKEDKKEIQGLETMKFQASIFDSIPYEWQAKELLKNIDSFSSCRQEFAEMVRLYKDQQLDSMQDMAGSGEFGDNKYDDLLLKNRNKNWVKQLNDIMKKESVLVAVGAGHLGGEYGLINLLKKEGYKVEPLANK